MVLSYIQGLILPMPGAQKVLTTTALGNEPFGISVKRMTPIWIASEFRTVIRFRTYGPSDARDVDVSALGLARHVWDFDIAEIFSMETTAGRLIELWIEEYSFGECSWPDWSPEPATVKRRKLPASSKMRAT